MNNPARFESIVLPTDVKKIEIKKDDTKPNTALFKIEREDHTVGQLLVAKLQKEKSVTYAGYKCPHPLEHYFELRISTNGEQSAVEVFQSVLTSILTELKNFKEKFTTECQNKRIL